MNRRILALVAVLLAAALPAPAAPPAGSAVLPQVTAGFAQVQAPRTFEFPRDHGPHPEFRQEWWYLTGNLDGAHGERFGFELTFFRFALNPPAPQAAGLSAWRSNELYLAHFAVSDVARGTFRFADKWSRGALGLAGAQGAPLKVWIDDWELRAPAKDGLPWQLTARGPQYQLQLELQPAGAPVLNGIDGLSRKSAEAGAASYYYSIPRLAAHGRLWREGTAQSVQGQAWLDREWGSGALGASQAGWDWFALQLGDGSAFMYYVLRGRDGSRDPYSAGTWVAADGAVRHLDSAAAQIVSSGVWRSPDGTRYPSGWRVRVPALALDVSLRPVLADQELRTTPRYWEGAVDVSGTRAGQSLGGRGYVELVGYAQERASAGATGAAGALAR